LNTFPPPPLSHRHPYNIYAAASPRPHLAHLTNIHITNNVIYWTHTRVLTLLHAYIHKLQDLQFASIKKVPHKAVVTIRRVDDYIRNVLCARTIMLARKLLSYHNEKWRAVGGGTRDLFSVVKFKKIVMRRAVYSGTRIAPFTVFVTLPPRTGYIIIIIVV